MHKQMERLYEAAKTLKGITGQSELARAMNASPQTVKNWESRGVSKEGMLTAQRIIGCSAVWIETGNGQIQVGIPAPIEPGPEFVPIERISIKVSAGVTGFRVEHLESNGAPIFFRADWLAAKGYRVEKLYALRVSGDSMEPNLWDGDLIVMNSADIQPKDGEVFVANYEGEVVIKRLSRDAGEWWLTSDNTRHKPKLCDEHAELIGRVIYKQSERV